MLLVTRTSPPLSPPTFILICIWGNSMLRLCQGMLAPLSLTLLLPVTPLKTHKHKHTFTHTNSLHFYIRPPACGHVTCCVISLLYGNRKPVWIYRKRRKERTAQTRKTHSDTHECVHVHTHSKTLVRVCMYALTCALPHI